MSSAIIVLLLISPFQSLTTCFKYLDTSVGCMCACMLSRIWLFATPWTVAHQAPLSMEFSRQAYRSGLQFPTPGDLPSPGIRPMSPALAGRFSTTELPGKPMLDAHTFINVMSSFTLKIFYFMHLLNNYYDFSFFDSFCLLTFILTL